MLQCLRRLVSELVQQFGSAVIDGRVRVWIDMRVATKDNAAAFCAVQQSASGDIPQVWGDMTSHLGVL